MRASHALNMARLSIATATIAVAGAAGAPLRAQTYASTMQIDAKVIPTCDVFALPLSFGTIPILLPNTDAQTRITVTCTPNTAFTVGIDNGLNFSTRRRMIRIGPGLGTFLNYEIYRNAARTQRWGNVGGELASSTAPANGAAVVFTAYGRAYGFVVAGPFQDTVTIAVTF